MLRLPFFLFSFVLHTVSVFAQSGKGYHIQQFTTDNGLPSNGIKGLQWDEQTGFLWIATEAGMSRYNGLDFTNFTKENTPGLSHERMAFAVKNNAGEIFVADVGENILSVKDGSLVSRSYPELKNVIGLKDRFFLSTAGKPLQQKLASYLSETGIAGWDKTIQLSDTSAFILTSRRTAYYLSVNQPAPVTVTLPVLNVNEFLVSRQLFVIDKERKVYAVKDNFQTCEPVSIVTTDGQPVPVNSPNFLLYWEPGMNNPILFSGNNAWLLHYRNGLLEAELICSAVPSYSFIRSVQYSQRNKMLFIGTDSKGIIVINENRLLSLKNSNSDIRERNAYYSQIELPGENVLTNESHIIGPGKIVTGSLPVTGKFDYSVYTEGDTLLWYSQISKEKFRVALYRYSYKTGKTTAFTKVHILSNFAMLFSGDRRYLATYLGFGLLQGDSMQILFKPGSNKKQQAAPYAMLEFSKDLIGVASCDGLILYNIKKMSADTILQPFGYCIRNLCKYKDYVFIGSYGKGFYIWKNGRLKEMPLDKNKFLLYTHCFVPDSLGYCWISSNRGLFKAKLSDLIDAFENNTTQVYYHYFGKNDGMGITEMNGGCAPCALVMKSGTISFPTMDGLLWVSPDKVKPLLPEGNIYIDEFVTGDKKINPDSLDKIALPFKERNVVIKLGFSAWCNKENIYLDYRLNNNNNWIPVDIKNGASITLNNLSSGNYKLQIRKMNGFGTDNYSYKEIKFTISTPWHQQWWFFVLSSLIVLGLLSLYFRFRTRQYEIRQRKLENQVAEKTKELKEQNEILEKNNTIKTRLISIISHDIVTPLKFLTVAGKNLLEKRKLMPEQLQQETIQEMTTTSQELQLLSTNILNWIKYQNENRRMAKETFNLNEMVGQVLGLLQSLAKQKNLVIKNSVSPGMMIHQYYEPLKILVYNLLTNAIHFTEKGSIIVSAVKENDHITVAVKDEGAGMTPEQIQRLMADDVIITSTNVDNKKGHGLGYLIIKDLLKTMGASLHIESGKGAGTTVSITM